VSDLGPFVQHDVSMTIPAPTADRPPSLRRRRLILLAIRAAVFLSARIVYRHYWQFRPMGRGPAGPTLPAEPFAEIWSDRPVPLPGIGDGITAGVTVQGPVTSSIFPRFFEARPLRWMFGAIHHCAANGKIRDATSGRMPPDGGGGPFLGSPFLSKSSRRRIFRPAH
jgi:hypothetical protein